MSPRMPFRDELEAARARIETLERDLASRKADREKEQQREPPFAIATVVLALLVVGMGAGMAMLWNRASEAEEAAASWRELEGQTGNELHEAQVRLDEARRAASVGPTSGTTLSPEAFARVQGWPNDIEALHEEWTGVVVERIGDAPVGIGQSCTFEIARSGLRIPHERPRCTAHVRCGQREVYPGPDNSDVVSCSLETRGSEYGSLRPFEPTVSGARRLSGVSGDLRIDDGAPVGTWSLRIADSR